MIGGNLNAARGEALGRPRRSALVVSLPWRLRPGKWGVIAAILVTVLGAAAHGTGFAYRPATEFAMVLPSQPSPNPDALRKSLARLRSQQRTLQAALRQKSPRGTHLIIDQTLNRLQVKKDGDTLLDVRCSAGSGMLLQEGGGKKRRWIFDTPRGQFRVLQKVQNPVWKKPDWAFVEEGKPIPTDPDERFEYGTLGEYALHFGNGYMIHGTLYERLIGRSVTHGCIRLGKEDLRKVWSSVPHGTPIYIY